MDGLNAWCLPNASCAESIDSKGAASVGSAVRTYLHGNSGWTRSFQGCSESPARPCCNSLRSIIPDWCGACRCHRFSDSTAPSWPLGFLVVFQSCDALRSEERWARARRRAKGIPANPGVINIYRSGNSRDRELYSLFGFSEAVLFSRREFRTWSGNWKLS